MALLIFSNEIFAMFIESLVGEDQHSLRACSLVSSAFRHFHSPILFRGIALDSKKKVDIFIQVGERFDSLQHTKSLDLTYYGLGTKAKLCNPYRTLDVPLEGISRDPPPSPDPVSSRTPRSTVTLQTQYCDRINLTGVPLRGIPRVFHPSSDVSLFVKSCAFVTASGLIARVWS